MIDQKIEQNIEDLDLKNEDRKKVVLSILIILIILVGFGFFMAYDFFKKPASDEKIRTTEQERLEILSNAKNNVNPSTKEERLDIIMKSEVSTKTTEQERLEILKNNQ